MCNVLLFAQTKVKVKRKTTNRIFYFTLNNNKIKVFNLFTPSLEFHKFFFFFLEVNAIGMLTWTCEIFARIVIFCGP